jgi:hypothetical protein
VVQGQLLCYFDSTHFKHGETVTFRIYAKTPEDEGWVLEATTTRQVVNQFYLAIDRDVAAAGDYADLKLRWENLNWGELPGLNSLDWTKAEYLERLPPCQGHISFTHGTDSGLWLEHPDEDVFESDVRASIGGPGPINRFAAILGCECGQNEGFLRAYLHESQPSETNRFVFGFKTCPTGMQGIVTGRTYLVHQAKGRSAIRSLEHAYKVAFLTTDLDNFSSTIGYVGDQGARLRYLYDGSTDNTIIWKFAP